MKKIASPEQAIQTVQQTFEDLINRPNRNIVEIERLFIALEKILEEDKEIVRRLENEKRIISKNKNWYKKAQN